MPITDVDDIQNSEGFADVCDEVKAGIYEVVRFELVPEQVVPEEKVPEVFDRLVFEEGGDEWAGQLVSTRHLEGGKEVVHAFMVAFGGIVSVDGRLVGRKGFALRFVMDSYYDAKVADVERLHGREIHKVAYALFASRVLRRPGIVKSIVEFRERRGLTPMGSTSTRGSLGEVLVELEAVPLVKPAYA